MAWEATCLLGLVLLVLLASGSWAQKTELLPALEGDTISVRCQYRPSQLLRVKSWCRQTRARTCLVLVDSPRTVPREPRYSIQDDHTSGVFTITMTELRGSDSGVYWCGISNLQSSQISVLKIIHLVVSQASTLPPTRSTRRTTVLTSATSPVIDSPLDKWKFITLSVVVAVLLVLVLMLAVIMAVRLQKARGKAGKGEDDSHHVYNEFSVQKEETIGYAHMVSDKDSGDICYASLIHLNHSSPEDSIYAKTHPNLKHMPDPILSVEYASITGKGPSPPSQLP
ncbi:natural cytotoxicity triggering receptor 2-like isoform X2 [Nycticebus coucang]|uniref:natural cytotoxicity triggering receptor 2-like isoform X2 n=1 Tax=Nycticebus coucang TaxID=9470 RepID=UPI00234C2C3F|nr:natural cytotoxicity triggering receptor 2-like isoform X2 [Nycticebus coucang]